MEKITFIWNIIHYNIFKWEVAAQNIINYPLLRFLNIPKVKKAYAKRGVSNAAEMVRDITVNKQSSINTVLAGIHMGGLLVLLEYGIFNFVQGFFNKALIHLIWLKPAYSIMFVLSFLVLAGIFNYVTLFKNDLYLKYFKQFEVMPRELALKYSVFSVIFILCIIGFLISSFVFLTHNT